MHLLKYIDTMIDDPTTSRADINDYRGVHKTLTMYLGDGGDTDILCLTQPRWIDAYYDYLVADYRSNKQRNAQPTDDELIAIANRYVKQLRKLINHAITDGVFPDIDIFSDTKIGHLFARRKGVTVTPLTPEFKRLVFSRDHRLLAAAEPYLIALYCCGLEIDRLGDLKPEHFSDDACQITLPHLRVTATYPETLYHRIHAYVMSHRDTAIDPRAVRQALCDAGYRLYASGSAFTDWLSLAIESGISKDIKRLISLRLNPALRPTADNERNVQAMVRILGTRYNPAKKSWYVLRTVGQPGITLAQRLLDGDRQYPVNFRRRNDDIYVPHIQATVRSRKKRPKIVDPSAVLKNIIFVNAEPKEAETLDRTVTDAYVMGKNTPDGKRYQTVPYHEIYTLQLVLHSISSTQAQDALQNEDLRDTIVTQTFAKDDIVTVAVPGFEEYTARVTSVKRDATYDLAVECGPFKIALTNIPQGLIRHI